MFDEDRNTHVTPSFPTQLVLADLPTVVRMNTEHSKEVQRALIDVMGSLEVANQRSFSNLNRKSASRAATPAVSKAAPPAKAAHEVKHCEERADVMQTQLNDLSVQVGELS
jgi:hypothetical protein